MATSNREVPPRRSQKSRFRLRAHDLVARTAVTVALAAAVGGIAWGPAASKGVILIFSSVAVSGSVLAWWVSAREQARARRAEVNKSRKRLVVAEDRLTEVMRRRNAGAALENLTRHHGLIDLGSEAASAAVAYLVSQLQGDTLEGDGPEGDGSEGDQVQAHTALALPELWQTTHARLGLYHDIATGQAEVSFRNAQWSMWSGFGLLLGFAGLAAWASTTAGVIVAGGLGAVAAALAGFVSKTFIRSQEAAANHLRSYFDQPLELSRYLAAERLVADGDLSQEQRGEILSTLVQAMVAAPVPAEPAPSAAAGAVPAQPGA